MNAASKRRIRFDTYLARQGLVTSRHQAADLIRRRQVKLDGFICDQPDRRLDPAARYRVRLLIDVAYVSRGGYKLAAALDTFGIQVAGRLAFDVGASAGGFTDVLCRRGARHVVALDVGRQPLDPTLASLEQVRAFNRTDIRVFSWPEDLPLADLITVDLSFISLTKIMPCLAGFCRPDTDVLLLAKPQFEAGAGELNRGLVKNRVQRREILSCLEGYLKASNWRVLAKTDAAIEGLKGNLERFYLVRYCGFEFGRS